MKIRLLVDITGTRNGRHWPARGGEVEVTAAEAADMVAAGMAEAVKTAPETAAVAAPENAAKPKPKARKKAS